MGKFLILTIFVFSRTQSIVAFKSLRPESLIDDRKYSSLFDQGTQSRLLDKSQSISSNFKLCKSVKHITPDKSHKLNSDVTNILKSIDSSNILLLSHNNSIFDGMIRIPQMFSPTDCFIILANENKSLHSITSLFDQNGIPWNYKTQIFIICEAACSITSLVNNFNSSVYTANLVNALVIDFRDDRCYQICASSKIITKYDLLENTDFEQSRFVCRVDLHGESIPITLNFNPPMTDIRNDLQKSRKGDRNQLYKFEDLIGLELEIMRTLMKMFNFRIHLIYLVTDSHNITDLSDTSDNKVAIDMLEKGDTKILANLQSIGSLQFNSANFHFTHTVFVEKACLVIDKSFFTKNIVNLYGIFQPSVYITLLVTFTITAIVWIIIINLTQPSKNNYGSNVMMLISVMSGNNVYR